MQRLDSEPRATQQCRRQARPVYRHPLVVDDERQRRKWLLEDGKAACWPRTERRRIPVTMLDAVYCDTVEEKRMVAARPKLAF